MTIICTAYVRAIKNSRVAFVDLGFPENGVILRGCHLHRSPTGKEWVSWPAVETGNGFASCGKFMATVEHSVWQQDALAAIQRFLAGVDTKDLRRAAVDHAVTENLHDLRTCADGPEFRIGT